MIDRNAIAAVLFRPVERPVGAAQERGGGVPGAFGKSGRNRDDNGMANDEFVATKPAQEIGFADDLFRASGEAFQNAISGVVAMPIVDRFETVEIENHKRYWASARSIEKRAEMGFEATAIFSTRSKDRPPPIRSWFRH